MASRKGGMASNLERRYGYFRCEGCHSRWESSHVYCIAGTMKVYYKQECKKCKIACNPYRVEYIRCASCGQEGDECTCTWAEREEKRKRHIDMNKKHRRDLCMKCRAGKLCTYAD